MNVLSLILCLSLLLVCVPSAFAALENDETALAESEIPLPSLPDRMLPLTPEPSSAYTVIRGDSLWRISEKFFGTSSRWGEIYEANKDVIGPNPRLLKIGQILVIPNGGTALSESEVPLPSLPDRMVPLAPGPVTAYTVIRGDSLWRISEKFFGTSSRWGETYAANKDVIGSNPRLLRIGQILVIPAE